MAENFHQIKPSTPSVRSDEEDDFESVFQSKLKRKRCMLQCCGCCMAGILFLAVLFIVLILTVFRIKGPEIQMNHIAIPPLSLTNTSPSTLDVLISLSVKNPNVASFKYKNSTTLLYYHGHIIGEAHTPGGTAKVRRTQNMNMSVEINTTRVLADARFFGEIRTGVMTVESYTSLGGRVKIINIIKKHLVVKLNCTVTANVTSQEILDQKCKRKIKYHSED